MTTVISFDETKVGKNVLLAQRTRNLVICTCNVFWCRKYHLRVRTCSNLSRCLSSLKLDFPLHLVQSLTCAFYPRAPVVCLETNFAHYECWDCARFVLFSPSLFSQKLLKTCNQGKTDFQWFLAMSISMNLST